MKPYYQRRDEHHKFQVALIEHLKLHEHLYPELKLIHANPMGEERPKAAGARVKAQGGKKGIPDLFLPVAKRINECNVWCFFHGLFIEIKADPRDKLSKDQLWWKERLEEQGYCYYVATNLQDTLRYIVEYLGGELR
jgi:hypothetical protein